MAPAFSLQRFLDAQAPIYAAALSELHAGRKRSHFMWFVFPQLKGLGRSETALYYGIESRAEAEAFARDPVLGARLQECTAAVLAVRAKTAHEIFGTPDDLKFKSSMTLFAEVAPGISFFRRAIEQYFNGAADEKTLKMLRK